MPVKQSRSRCSGSIGIELALRPVRENNEGAHARIVRFFGVGQRTFDMSCDQAAASSGGFRNDRGLLH